MGTINTKEIQYARSLIEASLDPLVTISANGKITDVNEASVKVTGVTRDGLIDTDFSDYFTEPFKAMEGYRQVFEKGFVSDYPLTIKHKNGKLTDVLYNASVYKDDKGNVLGVFAAARDITAQKQASQYARSLIEASLDPLVTINTDGKITDMNEATANITGISREKLTGTDFFDYFTEPQKAREVYQEVFAKSSVADYPLTLRHKDGKLTDVLFNGSVYKDDKGNVLGVVIVARDVAEQKWAIELRTANKELAFQNNEKEKRAAELSIANKELAFQNDEKEKRAEELIIANKELHFQNDEKEKRAAELVVANKELAFQNDEKEKRAAELVVANKELAFQNDEKEKRAAELDIANKELAFQNHVKEKRAAELIIANEELAFQNNEKEKRAAELFIANQELLFQTSEKEKRAAELVIADIELEFQNIEKEKREIANKELEAFSDTLKLASQYSLSLIEASLDPLVTISIQGKITDTNEASVNITGIEREKLIGSDFFAYFTEPQKAREVYQEVFAKGSVADSPLTLRHKNGKLTEVLFNGSVYKDDKGNVLGVVIVARDVTEQKRFENELIEARRYAERATERAEESNKLKEAFLANMSHEIRTPMNAIIGFSDILSKSKLEEREKELAKTIKTAGENLLTIINDILDISKIEAGMMTFEQHTFSVKEIFESLNVMMMGKAREKNLELIFNCDKDISESLLGDPTRLTQILINLAGNAIKFTPEGTVSVNARILKNEGDISFVEFSVKDTGIGIPPDKLEHIFERFRQAESHTTRKYGGTGLGLSIAKQLIELQKGVLTVKSELKKGSLFSFCIPYQKSGNKQVAHILIDKKYNMEELSKLNILLVEDNPLNVKLILSLFSEYNLKIQVAENGSVGIDKLKDNDFDIILMDMEMPVMNGYETADFIRKELKNTIPIIAMTAHAMAGEKERCLSLGMNDYISKPINIDLLFEKMYNATLTSNNMKENEFVIKTENVTHLLELTEMMGGKKHLIKEIIDAFLKQMPEELDGLNDAVTKIDYPSIKRIAHSMMSSVSIVGISELAPILFELERLGLEAMDIERIKELLNNVNSISGKALKELENEAHNYV